VNADSQVYALAYAAQLSRVSLGLVAGSTAPALSLVDYPTSSGMNGAKTPLAPLIVFLAVLLLFAACVLYIGLRGQSASPVLKNVQQHSVAAVKLAQLRLTTSGPVIYELFCAEDADGSGEPTNAGLFRRSVKQDRIRVGVANLGGEPGSGQMHFGLFTRNVQPLNDIGGTTVI